MPDNTPTIFISYSHKDRTYLEQLLAAVEPTLRNVSTVKPWSDRAIASGEHWEAAIGAALDAAVAVVLLLSNHFLMSKFILGKELPVLLPRERSGALKLFAVYVSAVAKPALEVPLGPSDPGHTYDLSGIQAENGPDRPLERMDTAERNRLFVGLAEKLHAFTTRSGPSAVVRYRPPVPGLAGQRTGEVRPECLIRLHRHGSVLERDFLLPSHRRWLSPELSAPDALDRLALWQPGLPFDGDLLFGNGPVRYREILANPYGDARPGMAEPSRWPWRIRLLIDDRDPDLQCLPWTRISHQGVPLTASGWTLELSPPAAPGARPERLNHAFIVRWTRLARRRPNLARLRVPRPSRTRLPTPAA